MKLWRRVTSEMGDQYLADKGFEIHDLMALRGASLYIPPKRFSANDHFTQSQCFETMGIAKVRIHVKRAIKRIKAWHIFSQVLPLSSFGSINQIWTVCFVSKFSISNSFSLKKGSFQFFGWDGFLYQGTNKCVFRN